MSLRAAARQSWRYFLPLWAWSAVFPIAFTSLPLAKEHPTTFFWAVIAPTFFVSFFLPGIPLRRGEITRRQRFALGTVAPLPIFAAAVLAQALVRVAWGAMR